MALVPIIAAGDGQRITVNSLVKSPLIIPRKILSLMENQFIVDSVLRPGGNTPSGVVQYNESTPLFLDSGSGIREEYGEYRIGTGSDGQLSVVVTTDRGLSIVVSDTERRRNSLDIINLRMTQARNTLLRDWDLAFQASLLGNASIPTYAAGSADGVTSTSAYWDLPTTGLPRHDIIRAKYTVKQAIYSAQANNWFAFQPDTMVISSDTAEAMLFSNDLNAQLAPQGPLATENLLYTGKLPNKILDLDVLVSRTWPNDKVLICERNTLGFIADEMPLQATPMYRKEENKYWRTDINRQSALGIDQPLAGCIITGVNDAP
jgi:hypothetical protein